MPLRREPERVGCAREHYARILRNRNNAESRSPSYPSVRCASRTLKAYLVATVSAAARHRAVPARCLVSPSPSTVRPSATAIRREMRRDARAAARDPPGSPDAARSRARVSVCPASVRDHPVPCASLPARVLGLLPYLYGGYTGYTGSSTLRRARYAAVPRAVSLRHSTGEIKRHAGCARPRRTRVAHARRCVGLPPSARRGIRTSFEDPVRMTSSFRTVFTSLCSFLR